MKLVLYTTCVCGMAQGLSVFVYSTIMHDSKTDRYIQTYLGLFLVAIHPYANLPTPSSGFRHGRRIVNSDLEKWYTGDWKSIENAKQCFLEEEMDCAAFAG